MERFSKILESMAILFVLGMILLSTQSVYFSYVLVLRQFDSYRADDETNANKFEGLTMDELRKRHEEAKNKVAQYERSHPDIAQEEARQVEPFQTEDALRQAIDDREIRLTAIYRVLFFWGAGVLFFLSGVAVTRSSLLLGLSLVISGFCDMIVYTSSLGGGPVFIKLVTLKLILSVMTILLLVAVGAYLRILQGGFKDYRADEGELG